jgi:hypothetical protein
VGLFESGFQASHTRDLTIYLSLHGCVRTKKDISHFGVNRMTSRRIPVSLLQKSCNILETLSNLLYLAEMDADDPQKVRTYLSLSKERVQAMTQLLVGKEDGSRQPSFGGDSLGS